MKQTHVDLQLGTMCEVVLNETYNDFKDKFDVEYDNQEFRSELKNINKVQLNPVFCTGGIWLESSAKTGGVQKVGSKI